MSRNYKFHNPEEVCFVTIAVVAWIDVFTIKFLPHERICVAAWETDNRFNGLE